MSSRTNLRRIATRVRTLPPAAAVVSADSMTGLLAEALDTPCTSTRVWACRQLAHLGPDARGALPALERYALFPNAAVRTAARAALLRIRYEN